MRIETFAEGGLFVPARITEVLRTTNDGPWDRIEAEARQPVNLPVESAICKKAAVIAIIAHYSTVDPLGQCSDGCAT